MSTLTRRLVLPLLPLFLAVANTFAEEPNRNVRFGLPSPAKTDSAQREDYLIERPQYVLSYNAKTRAPNWVCWQLRKEDIGRAARGPFMPDPLLPASFAKVTSHVYDGSGIDRGHMCQAKDRSSSQKDCDATFYLTNIVPQAPNCNQRGWEKLEAYCRDLVTKEGHTLFIVAGPHGVGGEGKNGKKDEIGKGRIDVTVPNKVWKAILVLPHEKAEPRRNTRLICIVMPNDQSVDQNWAKYRVSARSIERMTGFKLFPSLDPDVAKAIKAEADDVRVRVPGSK